MGNPVSLLITSLSEKKMPFRRHFLKHLLIFKCFNFSLASAALCFRALSNSTPQMCFHAAISERAISTSVLKPSRNFSLKPYFAQYYCCVFFLTAGLPWELFGLFISGNEGCLLLPPLQSQPWQARATSPLSLLRKMFYLVLTKNMLH